MIFEYSKYQAFLQGIREKAAIIPFRKWDGSKVFLLRHDIDYDLEMARDLAKVEAEIGVQSTFFFLPTCETYNVLSVYGSGLIREIQDMGHEIALHYDPSLVEEDEMEADYQLQKSLMEGISGLPIKSVSLHNPSGHGQYPEFDGVMNAYDKRIFHDDRYLSDSRMHFRNKIPLNFCLERIDHNPVQILLHPMHFSPSGEGYKRIITQGIDNHLKNVDEYFRVLLKSSAYMDEIHDLNALVKGQS